MKKMKPINAKIILIVCLFGIVMLSTVPFLSTQLYNWDVGQFALGVENFDVQNHQPHPPGYPVYIALAKIINSVINNTHFSLLILSVTFAVLAAIFFYYLILTVTKNKLLSLATTILFIFNPVFWFYREVALTYTADALAAILVALASFKILFEKKDKYIYLLALTLGIFGGIRPSLITLLFPLALFTLFFVKKKKDILFAGLLFIGCCLAWFIPLIREVGGFQDYRAITENLLGASAKGTSIFYGAPWSATLAQIKTFYGVLFAGLIGIILPLIISIYFFAKPKYIYKKFKEKNSHFGLIRFTFIILIWILPAMFIYTFIHFGQPGYILILLPAFYLLAIFGINLFLTPRYRIIILALLLIGETVMFLWIAPYATSPLNLSKANRIEAGLAKVDPWLVKFNKQVIIDNNLKFDNLTNNINNYLEEENISEEEVLFIVPRNLFYKQEGFEIKNDEIFRQFMNYFPNSKIIEIAPNRDYYMTGEDYKTGTYHEKKIKLDPNYKKAIFIAQKIETEDMPENIELEKKDRFYTGDIQEKETIRFLDYSIQPDCPCKNRQ